MSKVALASSNGLNPHSYALTFSWLAFWDIKKYDNKNIIVERNVANIKNNKMVEYSGNNTFIIYTLIYGSQSKLTSTPEIKKTQLKDKGRNIFQPKRINWS